MKLQEFITNALVDIASGVNAAREKTEEMGIKVGLPLYYAGSGGYLTSSNSGKPATDHIEFDIAVTVSQESGTSGGIQVLSAIFGKAEQSNKLENITHIKFKLPVQWSEPNPKPEFTVISIR